MANQAIALQARAPQSNILGNTIQQNAQFINMMQQQRAAERQAAQAQQQMEMARAKEAREVALAAPQMEEAQAKATGARIRAASDFLDFSIEGMKLARGPEDAIKIGNWLKSQFPDPAFREAVDQTLSSLPQDPAQFGAWREETLLQSLDAKDQLSRVFQRQSTGREERIISMPEYGKGEAVEVPGSRIEAAEGLTYVRGPNGEIIPVPKTLPGTGGSVDARAPATGGAPALATNPGALKDGPFARSQPGYVGSRGGFAEFETPEAGIAAQEKLLRSSYVGKGLNTIDKIISRYAPVGAENTAQQVNNYKQYVAQRTGLDITAPISSQMVPAVAAAMREFETGQRPGKGGAGIEIGKPIAGTGKGAKVATEAFNAMESTVAKYDETIARAKRLLNNPALDSIVGNVQGNIPEAVLSVSSQNAANALSDYNELLAVAGFQELQAMRDASPTGGALGQVSDSENRLLQQSAFASSRTQDETKFRQSLKNYIKRLEESKKRVENAYERTYGERFSMPKPAAAGGGRETKRGSNIDDLLKKYGG